MVRILTLFWTLWMLGITQAWSMCDSLIRRYEADHDIPHKLLTAISLVESGRKVGGSLVAWPWTINADKKSYVFSTKEEAISMVHKLRRIGITSIDVGCMQVNLKQHPNAFPTLEAAFDPETNIAYAVKFLKTKKMNKGSWGKAVAHYHSSTAKVHLPYKAKVLKTWAKMQNGWMTIHPSFQEEPSAVEMIYSEIKKHEGEFVENVAAPSGRRLPMVVRFAPYRGFNGGIPMIPQRAFQGNGSGFPKVIRGRPQGSGKIIVNTIGLMEHQGAFPMQREGVPD